jgi:hypothetical protein
MVVTLRVGRVSVSEDPETDCVPAATGCTMVWELAVAAFI